MLTNCAPLSLLEYLKRHVTALTRETESHPKPQLRLYVLTDEYGNDTETPNYSPKRFGNEFMARKNVILIYQKDQLVIGMTTFEYASSSSSRKWTRSYIQYVDTTGLYSPRELQSHLTKSLVKAYMAYCADEMKLERIHLLGMGKPSLLFAGSENNAGKRALPPMKLVNWWLNLVNDFVKTLKTKVKVMAYSPTEAADGSNRLMKRISSLGPNWSYNLPYESVALDSSCLDLIPLFEDDPKWRHFESTVLTGRNKKKIQGKRKHCETEEVEEISVRDFYESLQIRPEFRSDSCVFLVIVFDGGVNSNNNRTTNTNTNSNPIRDTINDPCATCTPSSTALASFATRMLGNLTFESELDALRSSKKVSSWLKLMGVGSFEISSIGVVEESEMKENSEGSLKDAEVVNCLQGSLIKRKVLK
jgi:hypothetical protein